MPLRSIDNTKGVIDMEIVKTSMTQEQAIAWVVERIKLNGIDQLFSNKIITYRNANGVDFEDWERGLTRLGIPNHRDTYTHRRIAIEGTTYSTKPCIIIDL